jgi:hypothetical protein
VEVQAVDSKGGQVSKLPSGLGTNLTKKAEKKQSSEGCAVPKWDHVLEGEKINSAISSRWWKVGQTPGGYERHGKAVGGTILSAGVAAGGLNELQ